MFLNQVPSIHPFFSMVKILRLIVDINDQCTIIEDMKYADSDVSNRWAIFKEESIPVLDHHDMSPLLGMDQNLLPYSEE